MCCNVSTIQAHEWMNDAHVYEIPVHMWKTNTWGVTVVHIRQHMVLIILAPKDDGAAPSYRHP